MRPLILTMLLLTGCQAAASTDNLQNAMQQATSPGPVPTLSASASAPVVKLAGRSIPVEVADTFLSRAKGLSGRPSLAKDTGLVLAWDEPEVTRIWMPDMNFAIDVVFVRDGKIVFIEKNAQPCPSRDKCPTFGPDTAVNYVLEVPAGSIDSWGAKVGDPIELVR